MTARRALAAALVIGLGLLPATAGSATASPSADAADLQPALAPGAPDGGPPLPDPPPATPQGRFRSWTATPSDVAGGIVRAAGEVVVSDAPFDDYGADLRPNEDPTDAVNGSDNCGLPVPCYGQGGNAKDGYFPGLLGGPEGEYAYPDQDEVYARNAADLVEARFAADDQAWHVLVRLNTLIDPSRTAVVVQVDGRELLVHGDTATLDGTAVEAAGDADQALLEVRVPRSVHDLRGSAPVFVASGLWDPDAGTWQSPEAGRSPYFDLLHVPDEPMTSYWRDAEQSADIAAEELDDDVVTVDWDALAAGACPAGRSCPSFEGPTTGLFSRTFRSGQELGPGVAFQTRYGQDSGLYTRNVYRAPYQPYAVYVPERPTGATVVLIHHLGGSYMAYPITAMPGLTAWAEELGVTVVMPHGRGEGGWYEGEAEIDVFEAWRDAATHHTIDRERAYLAGMSMGGYGTWRLSQLYPDLFARTIVWAGLLTTEDVDLQTLFGNTRNVPLYVVHGGLDPLVPVTGPERWMPDYAERGNGTYRYRLYPDRSHETTFPGSTGPQVEQWLAGLPARQTNPVRVTYKVVRAHQQPEFGIAYDGAYWADGMVLAPGAEAGTIEASRAGAPDTVTVLPPQAGADILGPFRQTGTDVAPAAAEPNVVDVRLEGLSSVALDTRVMEWSRAPQHVRGTSDGPVEIVLTGDYAGDIEVRGATFSTDATRLTLRLPAGDFDVTVSRRASAAAGGEPAAGGAGAGTRAGTRAGTPAASRTLPSTGGSEALIVISLASLAAVGLLRRRRLET